MNRETINQERIKELFNYNPDTGEFVRTQDRQCVKAGDIAGSARFDGYLHIWIDGKHYLSHRLAWMYAYGEWPESDIDHINCIKDDNRLSNLRDATKSQNGMNSKTYSNNSSGFKGVSFHKKRWRANIRLNGKQKHIGNFDTPELAHVAYCEAAGKHYKEFARFK